MNAIEQKLQPLLLLEDDDAFAHVVGRALKMRGYIVHHARDTDSALQLAHDIDCDYAILDLNLGGSTSLSLIPKLRQQKPGLRILMLTGYASIATAVEAIKLGADNYLPKPADADEIIAALLDEDSAAQHEASGEMAMEPMSVRRLEWEHIQKVLKENDGNISATARQLNMHRRTLQRKLQKRPVAK
jgi:two-component system response regulator RegA